MPPSSRAVLFDLDGTLVDSADDILHSLARTIRTLGLAQDPDPEDGRAHLGHPLNVMLDRMGYDPAVSVDEMVAVYADDYMKHWQDRTNLYPGMEKLLEALGDRPTAVVTQKRQNQAEGMVEAFGLTPWVDVVVGMGPGLTPKPAPDLLFRALERLGMCTEQAVMVGDTPLDVEAAREAGVKSVAVTWGFADRSALIAVRPDHLADTAVELRALLGV